MGNAPASPMPKINRITIMAVALHASAVKEVNRLHQQTISERALRGPMRSPSQPPGIWKMEYAQRKLAKMAPMVTRRIQIPAVIEGIVVDSTTRSIYVIMYAATVRPRT